MMLLLSITSFHKFTPEIETEFGFDEGSEHAKATFGRSEDCDWVLPDPERVVSGVHGEFVKFGDKFLVRDLSTNGIFINNSVTPIGQGNEAHLNDGDTLSLGDYQVTVTISSNSDFTSTSHERVVSDNNQKTLLPAIQPALDEFGFSMSMSEVMETEPEETPREQLDIGLTDDFFDVNEAHKNVDKKIEDDAILDNSSLINNGECRELNAFIVGLGINPQMIPQSNRVGWYKQLGESFSLMLLGLMETLHKRAEFKQNNRLNHTAFQKQENNPLKFSANLEDAIHNLYNRQTSSFMSPNSAIREAFLDIEKHEYALMKGVEGSVHGVMSLVDPESISTSNQNNSSLFSKINPSKKYVDSWRDFQNIHRQLSDEIVSSDVPFYLEDFAKYYEASLRGDS
ncbi:type VI secretion system-associated FHA domain protein TagH [Vibrio sp. WZ-1]|uniref:type VI secretion system-associated FHA domain protein TagH n=1 Tax=Vibrio sp. WZ-1 TaxID=3454501 RepID=UPI003F82829A